MIQRSRSFLGSYSLVALFVLALAPACSKQENAAIEAPRPQRDFAEQVEADEQPKAELAGEQAPVGRAVPAAAPAPPPARVMLSEAKVAAMPRAGAAPKKSKSHVVAAKEAALGAPAEKDDLKQPLVASEFNTERYANSTEQAFTVASNSPLSTFSIDVDTASYSNVRRLINSGQAVDPGAVRVEEMVNYFTYDYPEPDSTTPFSVATEVSTAPWAPEHQLVLVGLQGRHVSTAALPPRNLVFLLDVSGSMEDENKLPLLKRSFAKLLDTLGERDRVAIVVYAGASGLVLPSTPGTDRKTIEAALERLSAGGSTNGAAGIELAYQVAEQYAVKGGINRVVLATDGDFNVGTTSESQLTELIEKKRERGVSLTVLGFGMGNYNDSTLERLADNGNGNYAYIDTLEEAQKVLVTDVSGTMMTIAKDVKIQVEFNPAVVGAYRLIGYDNRRLADRDFNDDRKDAGEIGAGHSVTALYEVLTPEQAKRLSGVDALKYQAVKNTSDTQEMLTVKLRYKEPEGKESRLIKVPVANRSVPFAQASENLRFASAVATFGMYLRHSEFGGTSSPLLALQLANGAHSRDPHGYRREFVQLVSAVAGENRQAVAR